MRRALSLIKNTKNGEYGGVRTLSSSHKGESTSKQLVFQIVSRLMASQKESQQRQVDLASLRVLIDQDVNAFAYSIQSACQMGANLLTVAVTGASGQIAYSLIPRILTGQVFGYDTPVNLRLIDIPEMENAIKGVAMEVADCAFPLMNEIQTGSDHTMWKRVDYAFLLGAKQRVKGMERSDLLKDNGIIFQKQGQLLNQYANSAVLTLVVGNPANSNAMIAANNAPKLDKMQFSAMTRLDHERALARVAEKLSVNVTQLSNFTIWGNHSATQVPDVTHAKVHNADGTVKSVIELVDNKWLDQVFTPSVQQRGAEIIQARGLGSAASAADAAIKHMRDWVNGFSQERKSRGDWTSMALPVDGIVGSNGVWVSVPVICEGNGKVRVVEGVLDKSQEAKIKKSVAELESEKASVKNLIK